MVFFTFFLCEVYDTMSRTVLYDKNVVLSSKCWGNTSAKHWWLPYWTTRSLLSGMLSQQIWTVFVLNKIIGWRLCAKKWKILEKIKTSYIVNATTKFRLYSERHLVWHISSINFYINLWFLKYSRTYHHVWYVSTECCTVHMIDDCYDPTDGSTIIRKFIKFDITYSLYSEVQQRTKTRRKAQAISMLHPA